VGQGVKTGECGAGRGGAGRDGMGRVQRAADSGQRASRSLAPRVVLTVEGEHLSAVRCQQVGRGRISKIADPVPRHLCGAGPDSGW
jgi:hypothetical protein